MRFKAIAFDLDGTLIDSLKLTIDSVIAILKNNYGVNYKRFRTQHAN